MLSIPSKLMESCVASTITNHVLTQILLDGRQWAYRKGKSTEQLLIHLTERWREAAERRLYVGVLFIDFTKAFDTVSHNMLLQKLKDLEIRGDIWLWMKKLPHRSKTIRQNQRMRLRYTQYNSWSPARVGSWTHVIFTLHKRSSKLIKICGNLSVCR